MSRSFLIINGIGYYVAWLAILGLAHSSWSWAGLLLGGLFIAIHFWMTPYRVADLKLMILCMVLGLIVDGFFLKIGVFDFGSVDLFVSIPFWLMLVWGIFALLLNHALKWLQLSLPQQPLLGLFLRLYRIILALN